MLTVLELGTVDWTIRKVIAKNFLRSCLHAMVWGLLDFEFQLPHTKSEHFSAQFQPEESIDESSH